MLCCGAARSFSGNECYSRYVLHMQQVNNWCTHRSPWRTRRRRQLRAAPRTLYRPFHPASSLTHCTMPVRAEPRESLASTALANVSLRTRRPDMWWSRAAPPAHAQMPRPPRPPPPLARIGQSPRFISIALLFPFRVLFEACWCVSVSWHRIECSMRGSLRLRLPGAVVVGGCSVSVFPFGRMRSGGARDENRGKCRSVGRWPAPPEPS